MWQHFQSNGTVISRQDRRARVYSTRRENERNRLQCAELEVDHHHHIPHHLSGITRKVIKQMQMELVLVNYITCFLPLRIARGKCVNFWEILDSKKKPENVTIWSMTKPPTITATAGKRKHNSSSQHCMWFEGDLVARFIEYQRGVAELQCRLVPLVLSLSRPHIKSDITLRS